MVFRRPRVNVKPNVQATRPISTPVRSQESPIDSISPQKTDPPVEETPIIKEAIPEVEKINEVPSTPPPTAKPLFIKRIAPTIGSKTAIHHRRPSASCSGTESESESTRQKHTTASSITFGRNNPPVTKQINSNEFDVNVPSDSPANENITTSTEIDEVHTPILNNNSISSLLTRTNTKISREYLTQHITYRAQRRAAKIEPEMTIRKRRAATLEKIEEVNNKKNGIIDTSKLKIADFAHYNPIENEMTTKNKTITIQADAINDPIRKNSISSTDGPNLVLAPQLKIDANGDICIDDDSLYIRNVDETPRNTIIVEGQFNDDNLTHRSHRKIGRRKRWNNRDTLRFYQALRMCGTDFTLIAGVFPNRTRDDIKRKFKTEDKANRSLIDLALSDRIPFDLTCFYSPSEESSDDEIGNNDVQRKMRKQRTIKRRSKQTSSDPLEINRRREKRLQSKKNSTRIKSAEFIHDEDDEDEIEDEDASSMDVANTIEVTTTTIDSKSEQVIPSTENDDQTTDSSINNIAELENLLGRIDGSHLLFVHNTDETTGLDRIDVHVVMQNTNEHCV